MPTPQYDSTGALSGLLLDDNVTVVPCMISNPDYAAYVAANGVPKLRTRIPLGYIATFNQIIALYGTNQLLALKYMAAWCAVQAVDNPAMAADINSKLGTSIGFDQPAP